jgi:nucleotide-binding universal stress UspA family protein
MDTILAATDFSPVTKAVVAQAIAMTRGRPNGRIVLLHVVNPPGLAGSPDGFFTELVPLLDAMRVAGGKRLRKWKEFLEYREINVKTLQVDGFPAYEILRQARKHAAKYIVLGSHGHSGIYDLLVGSTASGVLKKSKCPVVVVRAVPSRKSR